MSNWLWLFCRSAFIFIMEEEFTCGIRIIAGFFLSLTLLVTEVIDIFQSCFEYFFSLFNASNDTIHYKINFENFDTYSPLN